MERKTLKSDAIKQVVSLQKRKIEQFEKMHESKKTCEELEKDEDYHIHIESIASSSWCPQTEEACYQNTFTTSSDGRGYDSSSAKSHFNRII